MMKNVKKDWFKLKRYPHIGMPLTQGDRFRWIEQYVKSPTIVAKHAFLPFIHKTSRVRKFRKEYSQSDGKVIGSANNQRSSTRFKSEKKREIYYASHLDSLIFSYYSSLLSAFYEKKIQQQDYNLHDVVCAYRSVPIVSGDPNCGNKCNIDFANDVFKFIKEYPENEFTVVAFDISSFFDNLNHAYLLKLWAEVIGVSRLPPDHFNVFKNITRFSHVDIVDIFEEFKSAIYTKKLDKNGKSLGVKRKRIEKICFLRNQNAIAFCSKQEFLRKKAKLLQPSKTRIINGVAIPRTFGIPQGSPISSILANIYLLHFDVAVSTLVSETGGIYRRYSDDIVVVCPLQKKDEVIRAVQVSVKAAHLEIQHRKTQVFQFTRKKAGELHCGQEFGNHINWNKNFIYLGFEFDGVNVLLKSASLSGYFRKMKRYVRRAKRYANQPGSTTNGHLFKRRILKKFSYKGAKRVRKYLWKDIEQKFVRTETYNWGNFLTYSRKAARIMVHNKINMQTKRHWNILNKLISE